MKLLNKTLTILFFFSYLLIFAQSPNVNWVKVYESTESTVYVDTSNIKKFDEQISALGFYVYPSPIEITEIKKQAASAKARILFNNELRNFTVIGTLYYDSNWKIIGETTLQSYTLGNISVGEPIDSSKVMLSIYNKCLEKLDSIKTKPNRIELTKTKREKVEPPIDTVKSDREKLTAKFIDKKLNEEVNISIPKKADKLKEEKSSIIPTSTNPQTYNPTNEKNVKGMIFSDGTFFCFQVSSWKLKSQAEREISNLKNQGHNAFVTEINLPNRGGNWFRVRVGYFTTLEETENYQRRFRK
ncbi:MAG: hypothetical protein FJ214_10460 [Ignavibacteria bacterium]|nr:hypothetical protein [Ignavibacteria bacterium]